MIVERLHPPDVALTGDSSFRDLLLALDLKGVRRILDVGAGGFLGQTTTVHLLELFEDAHLTAVEIDPARAEALAERFGSAIEVVASDIEAYEPTEPFDLIVLDLDTTRIPLIFDRLLPETLPRLATSDAIVITDFLCDYFVAFGRKEPLPAANALLLRNHLLRQFGRLHVTDAAVKQSWTTTQYDPLVAIDKWRNDPGNFIGWLALRRCRSVEEPAAKKTSTEPAPAVPAEPPRSEHELRREALSTRFAEGAAVTVDLIGSRLECGAGCPAFIAKWSDWCRTFTGGWYPPEEVGAAVPAARDGRDVFVPQAPVALLATSTYDEYMRAIGPKSRNMLRKCERAGYEYREFDYNDFLDDMFAINTSKPERSGGPMTRSYLEPLQPVSTVQDGCARHRQVYLGGFREGRLHAYCALAIVNELAVVNKILGHGDALADGVMNGLVAALVRLCDATGTVRFINYMTIESSADGLAHFKRSVGFRSVAMVAQVAPAA